MVFGPIFWTDSKIDVSWAAVLKAMEKVVN